MRCLTSTGSPASGTDLVAPQRFADGFPGVWWERRRRSVRLPATSCGLPDPSRVSRFLSRFFAEPSPFPSKTAVVTNPTRGACRLTVDSSAASAAPRQPGVARARPHGLRRIHAGVRRTSEPPPEARVHEVRRRIPSEAPAHAAADLEVGRDHEVRAGPHERPYPLVLEAVGSIAAKLARAFSMAFVALASDALATPPESAVWRRSRRKSSSRARSAGSSPGWMSPRCGSRPHDHPRLLDHLDVREHP